MRLRTKVILGAGAAGLGVLLLRRSSQSAGCATQDPRRVGQYLPTGRQSVASMLDLATGNDWEQTGAKPSSVEPEVTGFVRNTHTRHYHKPSARSYERRFGHEHDDAS
ncbi:hypothetical protein HYX70_04810 [Candidatus Saccharibacteria bacterium]|nr:hypothetical protein [Candidatus Saccharibacteria bacterium]